MKEKIVIELPEGYQARTTTILGVPELGSGDVLHIRVEKAVDVRVEPEVKKETVNR